jgi:hypothetical protein
MMPYEKLFTTKNAKDTKVWKKFFNFVLFMISFKIRSMNRRSHLMRSPFFIFPRDRGKNEMGVNSLPFSSSVGPA